MDVTQFFKFNDKKFDLIIADPPYKIDIYDYLKEVAESTLNPRGILCVEMKKKEIDGFAIDRYVLLMLYRHLDTRDPQFVKYLKISFIELYFCR